MQYLFKSLLLTLVFVVLTGCSPGPSGSMVDDVFEQYIAEHEQESIFTIENIDKTDGYILEGVYYLEFEYERHFVIGLDELMHALNTDDIDTSQASAIEQMGLGLFSFARSTGLLRMVIEEQWGDFSEGDIYVIKDVIQFIETENGWRVYKRSH